MKIKSILFDLGNVIIKFDPAIAEKGYSRHGKFSKGAFITYLMNSDIVDKYMEGKLTSSRFYTVTCKKFKLDMKFNEFYKIWNSIFYPYPEMEEIVRSLKSKYPDIKLVLVSNTNEAHFDFLKIKYDVLSVFDKHVVSHKIGFIKPRSKIFREALRIAGGIAKETFYTDDRPELISAARVLGLRAFQFTGHEELKKQLARFNILI